MEQATEAAESADFIQTELVEISADAITQCVRLFSAFSSEDAVRIFLYAENGIGDKRPWINAEAVLFPAQRSHRHRPHQEGQGGLPLHSYGENDA
jgi:hypothetical protein